MVSLVVTKVYYSPEVLTLKLPGGGPNGPTFKNIGYGSHMKNKMCYLECM